jgi:hypothetical protein
VDAAADVAVPATVEIDVDEAESLLRDVEQLVVDGWEAAEATAARVVCPAGTLRCIDLLDLSDEPLGLRPWLTRLRRLVTTEHAANAVYGFGEWRRVATATRALAERLVESNQAPLRRRDQLRGLLDAYRIKAADRGIVEKPEISKMYDDARRLLYTAPTDLDNAEVAVRSYIAALSAREGGGRGAQ